MKIALVLSRPPGYSETFFRSKIAGLQRNGFNVILFVDHSDREFKLCRQVVLPRPGSLRGWFRMLGTVLLLPVRTWRFFRDERRLGRHVLTAFRNFAASLHLLQEDGLTWIHFGFATMAVGRESAASALGARMGISLRGFDISRYPLRNPGAYVHVWERVHQVHSISNALLRKAHLLGLSTEVPGTIIHPAIDTAGFGAPTHNGIFPKQVRLLTVARLHWSKGIEYTLRALAILKKSGLDFMYTVVGDGTELERYVLATHQMGLLENVTFAGKVRHEDLPQYYLEADIYIQYSVQEGFCNAALEAQAMELPCIVSDAEGLPENVLDGKTGWVVPRCAPELLAARINTVIALDPEIRQAICARAAMRVRSEFDIAQQQDKFAAFFNEGLR